MIRNMKQSLLVIVVVAVSLAGCLDASVASSAERDQQAGRTTFDGVLGHRDRSLEIPEPVIVNGSGNGTLRISVSQYMTDEECDDYGGAASVDIPARLVHRVYDRDGPVLERVTYLPEGSEAATFDIPLEGTPPFLYAGTAVPCVDGPNATVTVSGDAFVPYLGGIVEVEAVTVNVTITPGSNRTEEIWEPGPWHFTLEQFLPRDHMVMTGWSIGTFGRISLRNAADEVLVRHTYNGAATGGGPDPLGMETDHRMTYLHPGAQSVTYEMDRPAVKPTSREFMIQTRHFTDGVCEFGFAWEGICT